MKFTLLQVGMVSVLAVGVVGYASLHGGESVDFSTQIKPLLNKHCIACHGGVKKQGGFSILFEQEALGKTKSGHPAIIPGDAKHSEFIQRLTATDPEERMPYKEAPLAADEIDLLTRWVDQGAHWGEHWAYQPPAPAAVPGKSMLAGFSGWFGNEWAKNDIDYFVQDRLDRENLKPAPAADAATRLRRVALDLTGLPPTKEQYDRFTADPSDRQYEKLVDELLASPAYGERWAALWLDLARYADSKGYEKDQTLKHQWRFRDYLIRAFNDDKPYDLFTKEVLAGDLLKNPTLEQYYATAFHRNTLGNDEGGTDDEEFRTSAVLDRVNTTMEVWQGTTFSCIQCHSHPYDPFRHEDYYKLVAFFNTSADHDLQYNEPLLRHWSDVQTNAAARLQAWADRYGTRQQADRLVYTLKFMEPKYYYRDFTPVRDVSWGAESYYMNMIPGSGTLMLPNISLDGKRDLYLNYFTMQLGAAVDVRTDSATGPVLATVRMDTCQFFKPKVGRAILPPGLSGRHNLYFTARSSGRAFAGARGDIDAASERDISVVWAMLHEGLPGQEQPGWAAQQRAFEALLATPPDGTPVTLEQPADLRRKTHVFERGNWTATGAQVAPAVPQALGSFPANTPANRLGLATWLTSRTNPLTARTAANRLWEQLFGVGLVETQEDFGTQGMAPSHPELLDHLALKYRDAFGWSQKKLLKYIVLSATYQQDSRADAATLRRDPVNRMLARGPRFRLTAEQIRDQALAVSGLLSKKMYGPSVMPYQPEGVWQVPYDAEKWKTATGEDQYRRAVYVFQKRSTPYPSMFTFDGSNRSACLSRRIRTNTPLQALVTLNDPAYADISRHYADRMAKLGHTADSQIRAGYQLAIGHPLSERKLIAFRTLYAEALAEYRAHPAQAARLLYTKNPDPSRAALTTVASALINLDEFITKE